MVYLRVHFGWSMPFGLAPTGSDRRNGDFDLTTRGPYTNFTLFIIITGLLVRMVAFQIEFLPMQMIVRPRSHVIKGK